MNDTFLKISEESTLLKTEPASVQIGSMNDHLAQRLVFVRPQGRDADELIMYIYTEGGAFRQSLGQNNAFELTRTFTQWPHMRVQVAFVRDGTETEHSTITTLHFRPSLSANNAAPEPWPDFWHETCHKAWWGHCEDMGDYLLVRNANGEELARIPVGGEGGTSNYNRLSNKPGIGGVELVGNKQAAELGLVAAEAGKGLSANSYTSAEKAKLAGIAENANRTTSTSQLLNDSGFAYTNDPRFADARPASDVAAWAKAATKPGYSKGEVGLGNADNTADMDKPVSTAQAAYIDTALVRLRAMLAWADLKASWTTGVEVWTGAMAGDKKVYGRVIGVPQLPNAQLLQTPLNINGLDKVVGLEGLAMEAGSDITIPIPSGDPGDNIHAVGLWSRPTSIDILTGSDRRAYCGSVFIEYTCTNR